jgi:hypothetical protein
MREPPVSRRALAPEPHDMPAINTHFNDAKIAFVMALAPDKAASGFIHAALDGTGKTSRTREALKGAKEDVFEVLPQLARGVSELFKGLSNKP